MKFYLNCGMVAALLLTVSLVRVSLATLVRGRERSTERLEVRSSAPSLAAAKDPRSAPASAVALAQAQIISRGDEVKVLTAAGVTSTHTGS
jgi:hypothetical protein